MWRGVGAATGIPLGGLGPFVYCLGHDRFWCWVAVAGVGRMVGGRGGVDCAHWDGRWGASRPGDGQPGVGGFR